jgi:hypothetical protein
MDPKEIIAIGLYQDPKNSKIFDMEDLVLIVKAKNYSTIAVSMVN